MALSLHLNPEVDNNSMTPLFVVYSAILAKQHLQVGNSHLW